MLCFLSQTWVLQLKKRLPALVAAPPRAAGRPWSGAARGGVTSPAVLAFHGAVSHPGDTDCCLCQSSVSQAESFCLG